MNEPDIDEVKKTILAKLALSVGKDPSSAVDRDWFVATALAARDRIMHSWLASERKSRAKGSKRVYYLSLEFLIGRLLADVLCNLGLTELFRAALGDLGVDLNVLRAMEPDAALGNGGLGRLAACFMESMATLGIPACGYGIRYQHGLFRQVIRDGVQQEYPEEWLALGNPWEFERADVSYDVCFGGDVEITKWPQGAPRFIWHPAQTIQAVAYDIPIVGWGGEHVNPLRLWSAQPVDPLRIEDFNKGDHFGAFSDLAHAEAISKFLYPSDSTMAGRELRLRQEYFFVTASLQDLIQRHIASDGDLHLLPQRAAIQLNDTHPSLGIAELMRLLLDVHGFSWADAWHVTKNTFSYTNHTLLPEALESWSVALLEKMLPRHLQIIYRINAEHLEQARHTAGFPYDALSEISLIDERNGRSVRMGHLSFVGSHRVNGVSALHTDLMRKTVFRDLHQLYPDRIVNKTNGITFRRWLLQANPRLTEILRKVCGDIVLDDPSYLTNFAAHADDASLQMSVQEAKYRNKAALARVIANRLELRVDPQAIFDVQIKRVHEYKRQLLNLLETVAAYDAIRADPSRNWVPRVKIFAGKAAASYTQAKLIIRLINDVAKTINNDSAIRGLLRVAYLPDYNVSLAESIIPAADLSEQISTAGMEASGTGNMKLALNGALTIGTLDGANIEIHERVGDENMFIFGLTAAEVEEHRRKGLDASASIEGSPALSAVIDAIQSGFYSPDEPDRFTAIAHGLRHQDYYLVAADFDAYFDAQRRVEKLWLSRPAWNRASILNTANMAWFSSDRAIAEYAREIWNVPLKNA
ncbi:MAG TPA: glycogen/starch/alpha-glucan phosphorylase [Micropepsaceae bacterium]|nr:glycogen/starch/alpha-glucan phosphorylase [Micropepsaceae bacterium]